MNIKQFRAGIPIFLLSIGLFSIPTFLLSSGGFLLLRIMYVVCMAWSLTSATLYLISKDTTDKNNFSTILKSYGVITAAIALSFFPMFINGFYYADDTWGFQHSQVHVGISLRRPFVGMMADIGIALNFESFYIIRIVTAVFLLLFALLLFRWLLEKSQSCIFSLSTTLLTCCSVIVADCIGYASIGSASISLFLSATSVICFDKVLSGQFSYKTSNGIYFLLCGFVSLLSAFCLYQIITPIVFLFLAIFIVFTPKKSHFLYTFKFLIGYCITTVSYLLFSKATLVGYKIIEGQLGRSQFIFTISQAMEKIQWFCTTVLQQTIYRILSILSGPFLFQSKMLFYGNILRFVLFGSVLFIIIGLFILFCFWCFYKKDRKVINLLLLLAFIPLSFWPFLILPENATLTYYVVPLSFLLLFYTIVGISSISKCLIKNKKTTTILCAITVGIAICQSNIYSEKFWVNYNRAWYEHLRNSIYAQQDKGTKIQVYGTFGITMWETYVPPTVALVLKDCGLDPTKYTINCSYTDSMIVNLTAIDYEKVIAVLTESEQQRFATFYMKSVEFSNYYMHTVVLLPDDLAFLRSCYLKSGLIYDDEQTIVVNMKFLKKFYDINY